MLGLSRSAPLAARRVPPRNLHAFLVGPAARSARIGTSLSGSPDKGACNNKTGSADNRIPDSIISLKWRSASKEEIFVPCKAKSAGIPGGSFEHFQRGRAQKDTF